MQVYKGKVIQEHEASAASGRKHAKRPSNTQEARYTLGETGAAQPWCCRHKDSVFSRALCVFQQGTLVIKPSTQDIEKGRLLSLRPAC